MVDQILIDREVFEAMKAGNDEMHKVLSAMSIKARAHEAILGMIVGAMLLQETSLDVFVANLRGASGMVEEENSGVGDEIRAFADTLERAGKRQLDG